MERKHRMTPPWLDALEPTDRPVEYRDLGQRGLVLRVEVSARKTWILRHTCNGHDCRFILGTYPEVSLEKARNEAMLALGRAQTKRCPFEEKRAIRSRHRAARAEAKRKEAELFAVTAVIGSAVKRYGRDVVRKAVEDLLAAA